MIQLVDIGIQYGERVLFKDVSFQIGTRDKIALVGRNGVGKSTIFHIINGDQKPDQGTINKQSGIVVGLLPQKLTIDQDLSVRSAAEQAFETINVLEEENETLQKALEASTDFESKEYLQLLERFNENLEHLHHHDVDGRDKKIELVLKGLGFAGAEFDVPLSTLSGGWQMRVELAKLLLQQPHLLLLDEPTNHLDIEAIIWLEQYIVNYPGALIVISHDQAFLRNTASRVIEIENSKATDYNLKYDKYLTQKAEVRQYQEAAFKNQQRQIAQKEKTIKRFMAKATKTSMAQSMQKQLNKIDRIELDEVNQKSMKVRFLPVKRSARTVLKIRNLGKSFGDKKVLVGLDVDLERGDRVAIVGQNGQGKTTLCKIMLGVLKPTSGEVTMGTSLDVGYYAQNQSDLLEDDETILEFMELRAPEGMRTRVRSILGAFMFSGEDVEKKIKVLSGGERARLALAHLLMQPINLLILDEPTNHLDLDSKEVLKGALMDYEGSLVVISHDRDFLSDLTDKTFELRDHKLFTYLGDVLYFLKKRELENMREVALQKGDRIPTKNTTRDRAMPSDKEAARSRLRLAQKAEKKVLKLEAAIAKMDLEMVKEGFYERPDLEDQLGKYARLKSDLKAAEEDWESLIE